VRQESLSFLADNGSYTKRFAFYVGRRLSGFDRHERAVARRYDADDEHLVI
jgi:hypothetical protein